MVITRPAVTALVVSLAIGSVWGATAKKPATKARTATRKSSAIKTVAYRKPLPRRVIPPAAPASERLKNVQQALIDRGYLQGEATGQWNASCIEALKRFEADQKVKVDGKIDSKC